MNLSIREAQAKDWKAIQKVALTVFEAAKQHDPDLDMKWPHSKAGVKYYKSIASSKENCKLVVDIDVTVVGYLIGGKFSYTYRKVVYGEIQDMGVFPHYRRFGIGTKLINEFRKWCKRKGYDKLYVNAYYKDPQAVSFYKKQGMTPNDLILIGKI